MKKVILALFPILFGLAFAFVPTTSRGGIAQGSDSNTKNGNNALQNNTTGIENSAYGFEALYSNTTGTDNSAVGFKALRSNIDGFSNQALGNNALLSNTSGLRNVAVGGSALQSDTTGDSNTAVGNAALINSSAGNFNTGIGRRALFRSEGEQNTGLGFFAGSNLSGGGDNNIFIGNVGPDPMGSESNTIRIGTQTATTATIGNPPVITYPMPAHTDTYIAGIFGSTTSGGMPVFVDANGKLGTMPSSARFKDGIKPMDKASEAILSLRPVTFRYKKEIDPKNAPQFGLIAEEVAKVSPDLVVRDEKGETYSVRYEAVNAMMLNEFIKEHRQVQEQQKQIDKLSAQLKEQAALIQKVSARVELNESRTQTVAENQ